MEKGPFDILEFRSSIISIVEELKLCRVLREENEQRIEGLLSEVLGLKHDLAEKSDALKMLERKVEEKEAEDSEKLKRKISSLESEKARLSTASTQAESELKSLKEEVCRLQMSVYSRNQQLMSYEQQLRLLSGQSSSVISRLQESKHTAAGLETRLEGLEEFMQRLEHANRQVVGLNERLQLTTSHQDCQMATLREQLEAARAQALSAAQELQEARHSRPQIRRNEEEEEEENSSAMVLEATRLELEQQRASASSWAEKYEALLTSYNGCLGEVGRQATQLRALEAAEKDAREQISALRATQDRRESQMKKARAEQVAERKRLLEEQSGFEQKLKTASERQQNTEKEREELRKQLEELEEQLKLLRASNTSLRESNTDLREEATTLRDALHIGGLERDERGVQTSAPAVSNQSAQTEAGLAESPIVTSSQEIDWSPPSERELPPLKKRVRFAEPLEEPAVTSSRELVCPLDLS